MFMRFFRQRMSSFQIIIFGFLGVILVGTVLLLLPISTKGSSASFDRALFTSTSAVCVTGLVVKDTAMYWSAFGQAVILVLIQIGGLGIITVAAFIAMISGRKISLLQRSLLQDSLSTHQLGGTVKMTGFIFKVALTAEAVGAAVMMPTFCERFGLHGVWMSVFHSVSAFCNAGFDIMGDQTGEFSSLSGFAASPGIVIPICLLINLVNNAVKNTQKGSDITISCERADNCIYVHVTDNGPGIPDTMKPHIFEMFYTGRNDVPGGFFRGVFTAVKFYFQNL